MYAIENPLFAMRRDLLQLIPFVLAASAMVLALSIAGGYFPPRMEPPKLPVAPIVIASPFLYTFNSSGTLQEAGSMDGSSSPYWWVNSGGELVITQHVGATLAGDLSPLNRWRILYALSNPVDTDLGMHPQNVFRLVTKSRWENVREEAYFLVQNDNFSASPNRNASNGLLLMSRYAPDGQTLYYAGVRVDGAAVIKKKIKGAYYTMAHTKIFAGVYEGFRDDANLIPHREWIGLRSETVTNADGSVVVRLFMRRGAGAWAKLLEATDNGQYGNTPAIVGEGYAGIRTDFMDVRFESYRLENL